MQMWPVSAAGSGSDELLASVCRARHVGLAWASGEGGTFVVVGSLAVLLTAGEVAVGPSGFLRPVVIGVGLWVLSGLWTSGLAQPISSLGWRLGDQVSGEGKVIRR
jgi:hypothetical protein